MGYNRQELIEIIREIRKLDAAQILESSDLTPFGVQRFYFDLSSARSEAQALQVGFPFRTIWFKNASSGTAKIKMKLNKNDQGQSFAEFKDNDILKTDKMYSNGYFFWDAQSNVNIEAYVFVDSVVESGSLINSGTISVSPSSTLSAPARVVADTTGTILIPANSSAKGVIVENLSTTTDIKFGGLGTTNSGAATDGITLPFGSSRELDHNGAIYVVTNAGTANIQYVYKT